MNHLRHPLMRSTWFTVLALAFVFALTPSSQAQDSKVKTWLTAEMLGAMRWAKAETTDRREKLDYTAAELICRKRLQQQIDRGEISKGSALVISENVRKQGVYRRQTLTLARADEIRRTIITGKVFENLKD